MPRSSIESFEHQLQALQSYNTIIKTYNHTIEKVSFCEDQFAEVLIKKPHVRAEIVIVRV